jgi:hypothetical protein
MHAVSRIPSASFMKVSHMLSSNNPNRTSQPQGRQQYTSVEVPEGQAVRVGTPSSQGALELINENGKLSVFADSEIVGKIETDGRVQIQHLEKGQNER